MSPRVRACTLCGWVIVDYPDNVSWVNQFRGLYSGPDGIILTGVGLYDDPSDGRLIAPPDPAARWDDEGYNKPSRDEFGATKQRPVNGRYGFVFHDACWSILETSVPGILISHERLFEICDSLPFPLDGVSISWGHDYGGLVVIDNEFHFPWEDRYKDKEYYEPDPTWSANPLENSEVSQVLTGPSEEPPDVIPLNMKVPTETLDILGKLPLELCSIIAMYLSTEDVLNLRLATRAFWYIFYSQQFWASRFQGRGERAWLFEIRNESVSDWRWLFRQTSYKRIALGLRNRQRIWRLTFPVIDLLGLKWINSTHLPSTLSVELDKSRLIKARGNLEDIASDSSYQPFHNGCRLFSTYRIAIPKTLSGISVCSFQAPDFTYITGVKLKTAEEQFVQIGYWNNNEQTTDLTELRGLKLGVGSRGVQSLQCKMERDGFSRWLGDPDETPKTNRLAMSDPLNELEVEFDGFKMIGVAARSQNPTQPDIKEHLRDCCLWYPDVPGQAIIINETPFARRLMSLDEYRPVFWTSFGGENGALLKDLTRISVICGGDIRCISFYYRNHPCQTLGRHRPLEGAKVFDFAVDGPGGELIEAVEVEQSAIDGTIDGQPTNHGRLWYLKISTTYRRHCLFTHDSIPDEQPDLKPLPINPGSTLTGFYASQSPDYGAGITFLGLMSEII